MIPFISISAGHKVVRTWWLCKIKVDSTYKGRLVVQGFSQIPDVDCRGTFLQSIRIMLAIAVELDYEILVLDVQTVFLKANVEEDMLVKMAPGCKTNDEAGVHLVMKLNKSL